MKKSKKSAPKKKASARKKSSKKANSKKAVPVKKKAAKKVTAKKKDVKKVIAKKPIKKPVAKKSSPKPKREPRPQLAMDFETVKAPEILSPLPDSPFMDGLGENLLNEAIQDTEDNMERDADIDIQKEADNLLSDADAQ